MRPDIRNVKLLAHNLEPQLAVESGSISARITPKQSRPFFSRKRDTAKHQRPAKSGALRFGGRCHSAQLNRCNTRLLWQLGFEQRRNAKQLPVSKRTEMLRRRQIISREQRRFHWTSRTQYRMPQRHRLRRADLSHLDRRDLFFVNHYLFLRGLYIKSHLDPATKKLASTSK
jgi:hypothetical protein